jgi:enamine deaminase RidA (YjgF/YER057c/UK114 family)
MARPVTGFRIDDLTYRLSSRITIANNGSRALYGTFNLPVADAFPLVKGRFSARFAACAAQPVRGIPVSSAVRVGKSVFLSGMPGFDSNGKLAVGDFPAQMKQVMDNLARILTAAGGDWRL